MMIDIPFCILFSGKRIQKFPQDLDIRTSRKINRILCVSSWESQKNQNLEEHYMTETDWEHTGCSSMKLVCEIEHQSLVTKASSECCQIP